MLPAVTRSRDSIQQDLFPSLKPLNDERTMERRIQALIGCDESSDWKTPTFIKVDVRTFDRHSIFPLKCPHWDMHSFIRVLNFRFLIISAIVASISWICSLAAKMIQSPIYTYNQKFNLDVYDPFIFLVLAVEVPVRHIITSVLPLLKLILSSSRSLENGLENIG